MGKDMIHTTPSGETIRVSYGKNDKRYYLYRDGERVGTHKSLSEVSQKFYSLINEDKGIKVSSVETPVDLSSLESEEGIDRLFRTPQVVANINEEGEVSVRKKFQISHIEIIEKFVALLKEDKHKVAQLAGMPILAKLDDRDIITKDDLLIRMDEILPAYINRTVNPPKTHPVYEAKTKWAELEAILKRCAGRPLVYLNDIQSDYIRVYRDEIYKAATDKKYINAYWMSEATKKALRKNEHYPRWRWHNRRLETIKLLLKNYIHENTLKRHFSKRAIIVSEKITLIQSIRPMQKIKPLTKDMSRRDFALLADAASPAMKLWMYIAVQACFTFVDISDLKKSDFTSLDKGTIYKHREKEGFQRLAKLNKATIEMLKAYMEENPSQTDYIFTYQEGGGKRKKHKAQGNAESLSALAR